jgi:hypothetical protein
VTRTLSCPEHDDGVHKNRPVFAKKANMCSRDGNGKIGG